jgi:hypothetical protein
LPLIQRWKFEYLHLPTEQGQFERLQRLADFTSGNLSGPLSVPMKESEGHTRYSDRA